jgi:hypothetical protein
MISLTHFLALKTPHDASFQVVNDQARHQR